jgi:hypothetical protein
MTLDRCYYPSGLQLRDDGDGRTLVGPLLPGASRPASSTGAGWSRKRSSGERFRAPTPPGCR